MRAFGPWKNPQLLGDGPNEAGAACRGGLVGYTSCLMLTKMNLFLCCLAVTVMLSSCSQPSAPNYDGQLDTVNCDVIAGWAWDTNDADKKVSVKIFDGETVIASVQADAFRPDLKAAKKGDGNHAFAVAIPASVKDGRPHSIRAKIGEAGSSWELVRSPQELNCGSR